MFLGGIWTILFFSPKNIQEFSEWSSNGSRYFLSAKCDALTSEIKTNFDQNKPDSVVKIQ